MASLSTMPLQKKKKNLKKKRKIEKRVADRDTMHTLLSNSDNMEHNIKIACFQSIKNVLTRILQSELLEKISHWSVSFWVSLVRCIYFLYRLRLGFFLLGVLGLVLQGLLIKNLLVTSHCQSSPFVKVQSKSKNKLGVLSLTVLDIKAGVRSQLNLLHVAHLFPHFSE